METSAREKTASDTAERREHLRVTEVELTVRFDGETYTTANWSMGGFLLTDYAGRLATGALVTVAGLGRSTEDIRTVSLPARVVRSGESIIAVNYLSLDAEGYAFLQDVMRESGKMRPLL